MLKELVSLIGKEQTKDLLEWLNGKTTFIHYQYSNPQEFWILDEKIEITQQEFSDSDGYFMDDHLKDTLGFTAIYDSATIVYYSHKPFDAQPLLTELNKL